MTCKVLPYFLISPLTRPIQTTPVSMELYPNHLIWFLFLLSAYGIFFVPLCLLYAALYLMYLHTLMFYIHKYSHKKYSGKV